MISVIPNGVDDELFSSNDPISKEQKEVLKIKDGPFKIIFTGAMGKANHDLKTVLFAAKLSKAKNQNVQFIFVGDGEQKKSLIELVKKEDLDNCIFIPMQSKEKIPILLTIADASVLSLTESETY